MRSIVVFSLLASVAVPSTLWAEDRGVYVGGGVGAVFLQDSKLDSASVKQNADFDDGPNFEAALGYRYGNGVRTEVGVSYHQNDVGGISNSGVATSSGRLDSAAITADVLYDFPVGGGVSPYVGVGAGVARTHLKNAKTVDSSRVDDTDVHPVAKAILGVNYQVSDPWKVFAQYEHAESVGDLKFRADSGTRVESEYRTNVVMVGLQYAFGASSRPDVAPPSAEVAAMPPVPVPPPYVPAQKSRTYMVFFDFDKADLTPEAEQILRSAAESARRGELVRVELTGHADRAGSEKYNMKLSERRAQAVKRVLVQYGLPGSAVVTSAKGESQPLVSTKDGVREPQNRRVEMVYTGRE